MFERGPWLGQVPLRGLGADNITPPFYGQWGLKGGPTNQVGPFGGPDEAFNAAMKAVRDAGAKRLPDDGFARVVDSKGNPAGPAT